MKIEKIEIIAADFPFKKQKENTSAISLGTWNTCSFVIAKVITDDGIVGWGESAPFAKTSKMGQMPVAAAAVDYIAPSVIGEDPFNIQSIWDRMDRMCPDNAQAKGMIDMAMYDIMGKASGKSAAVFMGGQLRDRIPLQAIICIDTPDNMRAEAERKLAEGYKTIRVKLGTGDFDKDVEIIESVRRAIGSDIKLRVDPNQAYTRKEALKLIPVLESNDIEIYEQPVAWNDLAGLAEINASTFIPVMPHESLSNMVDFRNMIDMECASLFQLKTDRPGGLTKACLARDIAELYNIPVVVMSSVELSISTFASMQLASTVKRLPFACEASGSIEIEDITDNNYRIENGEYLVPEGPGFGVEVDEEKLNAHTAASWSVDKTAKHKD